LVVQLELQTAGEKAKLFEMFSPRAPFGDPLKVKVPQG
jgi:hypothetical protein